MVTFVVHQVMIQMIIFGAESEEFEAEDTCDTHLIEQTERGFRCAIDVPTVLYK